MTGLRVAPWLTLPLLASISLARAIPPPPPEPPQLRQARMTVTIKLVETNHRQVSRITPLCKVSGTIPVYADDGRAAGGYRGEIAGCRMSWKGRNLDVTVQGALAIGRGPVTFATATVSVVPPDAMPLCPDVCAPQPLADSRGDIRVGGTPRSIEFSLAPNPVSMLNARPTVWLEADVAVLDDRVKRAR